MLSTSQASAGVATAVAGAVSWCGWVMVARTSVSGVREASARWPNRTAVAAKSKNAHRLRFMRIKVTGMIHQLKAAKNRNINSSKT
jgi:hypothetical protein